MLATQQHWFRRYRRTLAIPLAAFRAWANDHCARRSAALAFYTAFSLAPIVMISVAVAGAVFGADAAAGPNSRRGGMPAG
jgi:membrane protein